MVNIEIDGEKLEVPQGRMIIEAADDAGIAIPRFCYHKKLAVVANCRMCLVEVANVPKPLPACATPVTEGMKIFTTSGRARDAQKAVMEFLLINHPLDCPVCDQGGQCELQDVALEYGKDCSQFSERKRVVKDKNIGPLIATEMTRCIHCTRCVRFGSEIAGQRELGATGRGEFMEIGTFIEKSVNSEVSGNVIDLCPVGALTSKPFRFRARAWEMKSMPSISPHDCVGSHVFFHTLRDKVMRTLPREKESLNEVWLSDRDRFSYEAFNHPDRLTQPWIKRDKKWESVDWETALHFACEKLQEVKQADGAEQIGALLSPNATVEEFYLAQKLLRAHGCHNVDHRLRQADFHHQTFVGSFPHLGISLPGLEQQESILLIGSDMRKEQPLISLRLRKATLHGGKVFAINPWFSDFNFAADQVVAFQGDLIQPLAELVKAVLAAQNVATAPQEISAEFLASLQPSAEIHQLAHQLVNKKTSIILGALAWTHPQASKIYWLSRLLAKLLHATWGETSNGANSAGGALAGALPHRLPFGVRNSHGGLTAAQMYEKGLQAYLLFNCEPEFDCINPYLATKALASAKAVIVMSAFDSPRFRDYADVLLPITPMAEMAGTYVNAWGEWQSFQAAVNPLGESRPGWKVLRVLANFWQTPHFNYETLDEIRAELQGLQPEQSQQPYENLLGFSCTFEEGNGLPYKPHTLMRIAPTPLYAVDGITRRAAALQQTADASVAFVKLNPKDAQKQQLEEGQKVWVIQNNIKSQKPLPIVWDERVAEGSAIVAASIEETQSLGGGYEPIELLRLNEEV